MIGRPIHNCKKKGRSVIFKVLSELNVEFENGQNIDLLVCNMELDIFFLAYNKMAHLITTVSKIDKN